MKKIIGPTCLGEKPKQATTKLNHEGNDIYFCRCPNCIEEFQKNPEYYIKRLEGDLT